MKTFTLTITDEGEELKMTHHNEGFTNYEVIGLLESAKTDWIEMCKSNRTKPETDGK